MTSIFLKKYVTPMITATSTVKIVIRVTPNVRPKSVWHPSVRSSNINISYETLCEKLDNQMKKIC